MREKTRTHFLLDRPKAPLHEDQRPGDAVDPTALIDQARGRTGNTGAEALLTTICFVTALFAWSNSKF